MTIAQLPTHRSRPSRRQGRGAVLAGAVGGAALSLESVLIGAYLSESGFAIADGYHDFGLVDLAAAGLAALLLATAFLLPWLVLSRHGVHRPRAVAAAGSAVTVLVWMLLSAVGGVVGFVAAYASIIVVWSGALYGAVTVATVATVGILTVALAMPLFAAMARVFRLPADARPVGAPVAAPAPPPPPRL